jgi:fumarate reductase subunit C
MQQRLNAPHLLMITALLLGIIGDMLFHGRDLGISAPIFVTLCLAALALHARLEGARATPLSLAVGAAALLFAAFIAMRNEPMLLLLNLLATLGLLLLLVAIYRRPRALRQGGALLIQLWGALGQIAVRPAPLAIAGARALPVERAQLWRLAPVGRGLVIATPVLGAFTLLLMAADTIFTSYVTQALTLQLPFAPITLLSHTTTALLMAWAVAGGLLTALAPVAEETPAVGATQRLSRPLRLPGSVEALTVLLSVNLLFGGFMLVQAAYLFGGLDTLARTNMTYSEYARRGFFELLAVALLALGLLWGLAALTPRVRRWERLAFNAASGVMIALVLGMLASAFQRMWLYELAYGFTHLRIYTQSFMIWLAVVLILFLAALVRNRPRIFSLGVGITAFVYLAALNIANPDALITRENLARYQRTGDLDAYFLATLSADAAPVLIAALPQLGATEQAIIADGLTWRRRQLEAKEARSGMPGWNLGRAQALAALRAWQPKVSSDAGIDPVARVDLRERDAPATILHAPGKRSLRHEERRVEVDELESALPRRETGRDGHREE